MIVTTSIVWVIAMLIYLADCLLLVDRGQAIFERAHGRWLAQFGSTHYALGGKPVLMLNPVAPWRAAVRSLPLFAASRPDAPLPSAIARVVRPLEPLVAAQGIAVLFVLPILMHYTPGWPFLI